MVVPELKHDPQDIIIFFKFLFLCCKKDSDHEFELYCRESTSLRHVPLVKSKGTISKQKREIRTSRTGNNHLSC